MKDKTFEKSDWYKGNDAFSEYTSYYDSILDPKVKDAELLKFICKLPLDRNKRRDLIAAVNAPFD